MLSAITNPFIHSFSDKKLSKDINLFSFLILIIPIALISGPAIPDIILSIVAFYFLVISIKFKLWHYYNNPIVYGFLIFSLYVIIRAISSEYPIQSLSNEGSIFYFRYIFFSMGVWYLVDKNPYLTKCILIIVLICCFIVMIDGFYQYFYGINLFGNKPHNAHRLTGLFIDEPIIGRYISFFSIFAFALIYQVKSISKKNTIMSIGLLVICEIFVFFSGERAPFFYLALFSVLILIFIPSFRAYRLIGVIFSILIIAFIININPKAKERMVNTTIQEISNTSLPFLPYSELHERHFVVSLKMFQDKPFFGIGTNSFKFFCDKEKYFYKENSCTTHPHNYYIQLIAELGVVGFLTLFLFFSFLSFILLRQFYYILKKQKSQLMPFNLLLFVIVLFVFWWPIIPHMSFYNNWNNVMVFFPLGFFLRDYYKNNIV